MWPRLILAFALILGGCATTNRQAHQLDRVAVSPDGKGFVLQPSGQPFHPWGMNYGNAGRLMEDFWETDWKTLADDFREMQALGANVVRVHLQYGKFMRNADEPNLETVERLRALLQLAESTGLHLDITGLACYRASDNPVWYDELKEAGRWRAQARFWEVVAETCAGHSAVFCYDLINEPVSPGDKRAPGTWRSGSDFGGFDFLQFIALDPNGRTREEIPVQWIHQMSSAIRRYDSKSLITVGLLPWSRGWKHISGFIPEKIAPELDFQSVHIYPDSKTLGEEMDALEKVAVGQPVVIEETFPLGCTPAELKAFLLASKRYATGWIGHYDGKSLDELDSLKAAGKLDVKDAVYRSWMDLFVSMKAEMLSE